MSLITSVPILIRGRSTAGSATPTHAARGAAARGAARDRAHRPLPYSVVDLDEGPVGHRANLERGPRSSRTSTRNARRGLTAS